MKHEDVANLIYYFGKKNFDAARKTIEMMITKEKANKNFTCAKSLQASYNYWGNTTQMLELPPILKEVVYGCPPTKHLSDIYLEPAIITAAQSIIKEFNNIDKLHNTGLSPRNKILLGGLTGNGKTSFAEAFSNELDLKFVKINITQCLGSTMGSTGHRIDSMFKGIAEYGKCLLFLDEIDSIATTRHYQNGEAAAEMARIVNTLLTDIDNLADDVLLIGSTNLPEMLDKAILRRFKLKLWLNSPTDEAIVSYINNYQDKHNVNFGLINTKGLSGQSWSKVEDFCQNIHRNIVLDTNTTIFENIWIGKKGA